LFVFERIQEFLIRSGVWKRRNVEIIFVNSVLTVIIIL